MWALRVNASVVGSYFANAAAPRGRVAGRASAERRSGRAVERSDIRPSAQTGGAGDDGQAPPRRAQANGEHSQKLTAKSDSQSELTETGLTTGGDNTRTDYIHRQELQHLLAALTAPNRLAMELSLATGLRIGDVLNMRTQALVGASDGRLTIRELKTGKNRRIRVPSELQRRALGMAGRVYIFEGRTDYRKHRTRQAVYKDIKRIARMFRLRCNIAPHTARKVFAVEQYKRDGNLARVQRLLNHSSEAITMLYAMADELTARRIGKAPH